MSTEWKRRREGGGRLGMQLLLWVGRHGGRSVARLFLYPITVYFLLRRGAERRDSQAYLTRVLGRRAGWRDVARHIHTFSATILDRLFLLDGQMQRFQVQVQGVDVLNAHLDQGKGVLLFGSHLGSFEVLRVLSRQRPGAKIRVLMDKGHSAALTRLLDAIDPQIAATVIDARQDGPTIMLQIKQAADEGAMVALLVDRAHPGEPTESVPFLGAPAAFPVAPWMIAAVLKIPVMLTFGLYRGGNRYDLVFEPFSDGIDLPRRARAAALPALIGRYAARLEHHARSAPDNWFNFYDFWKHDDAGNDRDKASDPVVAGPAGGGPAAVVGRRTDPRP